MLTALTHMAQVMAVKVENLVAAADGIWRYCEEEELKRIEDPVKVGEL